MTHIATRAAAATVGALSIAAGVRQGMRGVPIQGAHAPLHTAVLVTPLPLLLGIVLLVIACSPRRLWW